MLVGVDAGRGECWWGWVLVGVSGTRPRDRSTEVQNQEGLY